MKYKHSKFKAEPKSDDCIKDLIYNEKGWIDLDFLFPKTHLSFAMLRIKCNRMIKQGLLKKEKRGSKMFYKSIGENS
jgi:DNA-binding transcriptional regulator PaaX